MHQALEQNTKQYKQDMTVHWLLCVSAGFDVHYRNGTSESSFQLRTLESRNLWGMQVALVTQTNKQPPYSMAFPAYDHVESRGSGKVEPYDSSGVFTPRCAVERTDVVAVDPCGSLANRGKIYNKEMQELISWILTHKTRYPHTFALWRTSFINTVFRKGNRYRCVFELT